MNNEIALKQNYEIATAEELAKFVLIGREKLIAMKAEISAIKKLGLAKDVYKQKMQEAQELSEMCVRAEVRVGEILNEMPKATKGTGNNQYKKAEIATTVDFSYKEKQSQDIKTLEFIEEKPKPQTKAQAISDLGFTQKQAERFQTMAKNKDIVETAIEYAKQNDDTVSRSLVLNMVQEKKKEEKIAQREQQIEEIKENIKQENLVINHKHDVVILDPPWDYGRKYDPESSRVANPYPEMTQSEIMEKCKGFHKDNSIMYLWTTHQFMFNAKELLDAWGFEYKSCIVWDKEKIGMGHWFRMQCEFCLVGVKGKPLWENTTYRDIIREPRREHSRKPEAFYNMIRELHKGMSIFEYFSREKREGIINAGVELE